MFPLYPFFFVSVSVCIQYIPQHPQISTECCCLGWGRFGRIFSMKTELETIHLLRKSIGKLIDNHRMAVEVAKAKQTALQDFDNLLWAQQSELEVAIEVASKKASK